MTPVHMMEIVMTRHSTRLLTLGVVIALGFAAQAGSDGNIAQVASTLMKAVHGTV